jgi:glycosyltransferase involved in cell wall biosynthesis
MAGFTEKKITVALFSGRYEGGVTSISELVLGLDENRFDVMFIYLSGYGADGNPTKRNGRKVFYLSEKKQVRTFNLSILFKLKKILKEQKVAIIHCQTHKTTLYGTLAAMLARTPVVLAHVHGLNRSRRLRRKLVNLLLFRRVNRIIPVANKVKDDVLRSNWFLSEDKLFVLENSVDYERFANVSISKQQARILLGLPPQAFVFGTIGRMAPTKGYSFLIEAFTNVKLQLPASQLIFIGDGPLRNELEQQAAKTPCADSIHFLGHRNNVPELLRAMDVFVLSSIAEGMPRAILEVMAAGVPCVAAEVGGIPEIINSKDVGILVKPKDSSALAEAMINVANMPPQELIKLTEKARDRIRRFYSHDVVRGKIRNLYEAEMKKVLQNSR